MVPKDFQNHLITTISSVPLIYIPHYDMMIVEDILMDILHPQSTGVDILELDYKDDFRTFDDAMGLVRPFDGCQRDYGKEPDLEKTLLSFIFPGDDFGRCVMDGKGILLLKNVFQHLLEPKIQALLDKFVMRFYKGKYPTTTTIIIAGTEPIYEFPALLQRLCTIVELRTPKENEITQYIQEIFKNRHVTISQHYKYEHEEIMNELVKTLQGLHFYEIKQILSSTLCRTSNKISAPMIRYALEEKKQVVKKSGIIEVIDSDVSLNEIGGLDNLKNDIRRKRAIFRNLALAMSNRARLQLPKGILIFGMPGCGKSMIAKAIANEFNVSLLRLDVNRLMGKYVGDSERNLRQALQAAEAAHPCVLWIDEIEKAFAGTDDGKNEIIVRMMGHFLTWMQERKTAVYVVATANDVLKPELMRKGRFDEVYFVDFPNKEESISIFKKHMLHYDKADLYDIDDINNPSFEEELANILAPADSPIRFSGAEINYLVSSAFEDAFIKYTELINDDKISHDKKVRVSTDDIIQRATKMRKHLLANQLKKNPDGKIRETTLYRIMKLQEEHDFVLASGKL